MSTASHICRRKEVSLCFAAQILHSQSTASVKKAGTGWEHWISQITDHLKPPTVAKRCTFLESRKSPALRGFVAGRWALATTSLYPSTKIERPQRARNGAPRRRSSSEFSCGRAASIGVSCVVFPTPLPKAAHMTHTAATGAFLWSSGSPPGVGVGHAHKCARLPFAASQVLCSPHPRVGKKW